MLVVVVCLGVCLGVGPPGGLLPCGNSLAVRETYSLIAWLSDTSSLMTPAGLSLIPFGLACLLIPQPEISKFALDRLKSHGPVGPTGVGLLVSLTPAAPCCGYGCDPVVAP